ncbi:hypothetical protein HPB51_014097 [Rhipicephalus microplus]|uniref:Uncharacterized protein n=1 Tax=Rhipicephalus microplus TaxID=6941 RepID=A0A9J6DV95_RHIMP|nr:hypothetical protein HPB51_014097 [Rhipicephalus microplus]
MNPNCPRCERQALNKARVWKAFENELRELQPCRDHAVSSKAAETRHSRTPTKAEKSRSNIRSKLRRKSKTRSKSRTHSAPNPRLAPNPAHAASLGRSCSCEESRRPSKTRAPSPSLLQSYKKVLKSRPVGKEVHAFFEQQRALERKSNQSGTSGGRSGRESPTACTAPPITLHRVPPDH